MMDILLVQQRPAQQIRAFLAVVFHCPIERVKIFSLEEFNSLSEELDGLSFDCVCVFSPVRGDVAQGSMPFCVELDNIKDTDAPIHQPAAMLVAAD